MQSQPIPPFVPLYPFISFDHPIKPALFNYQSPGPLLPSWYVTPGPTLHKPLLFKLYFSHPALSVNAGLLITPLGSFLTPCWTTTVLAAVDVCILSPFRLVVLLPASKPPYSRCLTPGVLMFMAKGAVFAYGQSRTHVLNGRWTQCTWGIT